MMLLNLAVLLVASLASVNAECRRNNVPCLDYTVLQTHEGYEERSYPPITWISATAEGMRKMDISRPLIKQLYAYLNGGNDRSEKIQMAVPFRTKKIVNEQSNTYTIAIPLTPEQSENPPVPLNKNVTIIREPGTIYVTKSFGGLARQDDVWDSQADGLKIAIANDAFVDTSFYYMSVYDSPWRKNDRLNEVWMVKRN